ncbi:ribonuclease III [Corynebacterium pyruviciproducens]|uniref:ribonuclease III n=1 Tax=Corynebacterium pyruviciproducens TaxID=598660 RepID=UPI00245667F3|nr:ribonuclease III [Corynebacterium pyruviciproducens]MDH4657073.1 ribonuclease III [Corynebacterium pyruviciproducens]
MTKKKRLTGEAALEEAFTAIDHKPLLEKLGTTLTDEHLCLALTHRSFANENGGLPNNERLEFLGDSVLGCSVAYKLFETYPSSPESVISKMRARIVSRYGLADIAREIGLGEHILLGHGEILTDGRNKDSILADTTEALFGAIFLEHGFETARHTILTLFNEKIVHASSDSLHTDWKTLLQERAAERKLPMPEYQSSFTGPDHDRFFTATAVIDGQVVGTGQGHNKKSAEQRAAKQAVSILREQNIARTAGS